MKAPSRIFLILVIGSLPALAALRASEELRISFAREAESVRPPAYVPGEVIVQFKSAQGEQAVERRIREVGGIRARRGAFAPRYLVTLEGGLDVPEAAERLRAMPEVDFAEPNGTLRAFQSRAGFFTPDDRLFPLQWHMRMVNAERTWAIQSGSRSVAVAVLDSGVAYEDFGPFRKAPDWGDTPFLPGFNVFTRDNHANDDNSHGTHVASTVAEATNNAIGVAGLAFGCSLMPVKVLDHEGVGSFFGVAEGIDYAVNFSQGGRRPVKVINLSLGGEGFSQSVRRAVDSAVQQGVVVVAAAGNENQSPVSFPASLPNVIAVGAVDARKEKARYSNFGADLDVVAPGGDLRRDDDRDGRPDGILQQTFDEEEAGRGRYDDFAYFFATGTSSAAPHVAALAALLITQGITDPTAVKAAIESTAEDLGTPGRDDTFGHGLIRPAEALKGLGLGR